MHRRSASWFTGFRRRVAGTMPVLVLWVSAVSLVGLHEVMWTEPVKAFILASPAAAVFLAMASLAIDAFTVFYVVKAWHRD